MTLEALPALDSAAAAVASGLLPAGVLVGSEISAAFVEVRRRIASLEAVSADLVEAADRQGVPESEGFGSTTAWMVGLSGDPPSVCRSRQRTAQALREMPETRAAFAAGSLSEPRVRLLADLWETSPEVFARDEGLLVEQARSQSARVFPLAMSHWRRLADPDGAREHAEGLIDRRYLHVSRTWQGLVRLDGNLDPEAGTIVIEALASLSVPDRDDRRTPQKRRADALAEICRRHLDAGNCPVRGGEKPHLLLPTSLPELQAGGVVDLEAGPITAEAARRLACDAQVVRLITDSLRKPLGVGRATRMVPAALRRALVWRDRHCTHPGCDMPAEYCDAHHIVHWAHGGETCLDNLRLLCRRHHGRQHDREAYPQLE